MGNSPASNASPSVMRNSFAMIKSHYTAGKISTRSSHMRLRSYAAEYHDFAPSHEVYMPSSIFPRVPGLGCSILPAMKASGSFKYASRQDYRNRLSGRYGKRPESFSCLSEFHHKRFWRWRIVLLHGSHHTLYSHSAATSSDFKYFSGSLSKSLLQPGAQK